MRTAIAVDTNSGIMAGEAGELGLFALPMPFTIDEKEYREGIDLTRSAFFDFLDAGAEVLTSQPSVTDMLEFWDRILEDYDELVYIPMSSGLSSSLQTALAFSQEEKYEGRVWPVNNQRISITQRYSAMEALYMAEQGKSGREIKDFLEETRFDSSIYIMVDTLKYLQKGGRVTKAGAAIAAVLNLKPVLQIQGEKLDAYSKVRGLKQAKLSIINALKKDIEERFGGMEGAKDRVRIDAAHTVGSQEAQAWHEELKAAFPGFDTRIDPLALSVSCHICRGALAAAVSVKHFPSVRA